MSLESDCWLCNSSWDECSCSDPLTIAFRSLPIVPRTLTAEQAAKRDRGEAEMARGDFVPVSVVNELIAKAKEGSDDE